MNAWALCPVEGVGQAQGFTPLPTLYRFSLAAFLLTYATRINLVKWFVPTMGPMISTDWKNAAPTWDWSGPGAAALTP